jgi:hypothetical protein
MSSQTRIAVLLCLMALSVPVFAAERTEELFQRALIKESVERDLEGAIHIYQRVVDEAGSDNGLIADARLRMAICFEKLDKPDYAEGIYRQLLAKTKGASADVVQQARTNLRRIESEKRVIVSGSTGPPRGTWAHEFIPSRYSLLIGPDQLYSHKGEPNHAFMLGLRIRATPLDRPTAWYYEVRGVLPLSDGVIAKQTEPYDSVTDQAALTLKSQLLLGVVGELPHPAQTAWIPELGFGLARTSSKMVYANSSSRGEESVGRWSPYFDLGIHFAPQAIVSFFLKGRYLPNPFPTTITIATPLHVQTFDIPRSEWQLETGLQIKLGHRKWKFKTPS